MNEKFFLESDFIFDVFNLFKNKKKYLFFFIFISWILFLKIYLTVQIKKFLESLLKEKKHSIKNFKRIFIYKKLFKDHNFNFCLTLIEDLIKYNSCYINKILLKFLFLISNKIFSKSFYKLNFIPSLIELKFLSNAINNIIKKICEIKYYLNLMDKIK